MKIFAHTLVHNEENFVWFALMSVVEHVDKIIVWDTGSSDKTVQIVNKIKNKFPKKIEFKEVGGVDSEGVSRMRQKMLEESKCDWILILDGDEVWTEAGIKELRQVIKKDGNKLDCIAVHFYNLIGDIWHYQDEKAGKYVIGLRRGHLQIKAINRQIKGLKVMKPYPLEGYYNYKNELVQKSKRIKFLDNRYFHLSHLRRSSKERKYNKLKLELGYKFSRNFALPEVFYAVHPKIVKDPWGRLSGKDLLFAVLFTPIKQLRRHLFLTE